MSSSLQAEMTDTDMYVRRDLAFAVFFIYFCHQLCSFPTAFPYTLYQTVCDCHKHNEDKIYNLMLYWNVSNKNIFRYMPI